MNYDSELRLVSETLRRYGLTVTIADPKQPVSKYLPSVNQLLALDALQENRPLEDYMPPVAPATVYRMTDWFGCCYMYFPLPDFDQNALLIIGPYLTEPVSTRRILEQAEAYQIDPQHYKSMQRYFESLPLLHSSSHLYILLDTFFEWLWGTDGYAVETIEQELLDQFISLRPQLKLTEEDRMVWNMEIMEKRYARENMLIDAVRLGQLQKIENILSRIPASAFEQRLPDQMRNFKNYCIISNTLLRKAAEHGGVHPVYLDSVSSSFAIRIEQLTTPGEAPAMIAEIAKSYCRLVRKHSMKNYCSTVQKAIIAIDSDLTADLSLRYLADMLNVNSSYLSALFKKETGKTVTKYIWQQRIEHARHLLDTTRLQIQTIAQYCGIPDVHYFSKIFKTQTGMTPKEYRRALER